MNSKENKNEEIVKLNEKIDDAMTQLYLMWQRVLAELKKDKEK